MRINWSKYRAKKMTVDGITFASTKEGNRYIELKMLQEAGVIKDLRIQVPFILYNPFKKRNGKTEPGAKYVADFTYTLLKPELWGKGFKQGEYVVEDVKGIKTPLYRLKKKTMYWIHRIEIFET